MLKSIIIKENINISHLMYLTISYITKKFNFVFKRLYKNVIQSFIHLSKFRKNSILIKSPFFNFVVYANSIYYIVINFVRENLIMRNEKNRF